MFSRRSGRRCQKEMVMMQLHSQKVIVSCHLSECRRSISSIRHICISAVALVLPQMLADLPRSGGHERI
jgi:hypothetical protein